jgi:hypothetical protein
MFKKHNPKHNESGQGEFSININNTKYYIECFCPFVADYQKHIEKNYERLRSAPSVPANDTKVKKYFDEVVSKLQNKFKQGKKEIYCIGLFQYSRGLDCIAPLVPLFRKVFDNCEELQCLVLVLSDGINPNREAFRFLYRKNDFLNFDIDKSIKNILHDTL